MRKTLVVSLELNELNFDYVGQYVAKGLLPNFAALLREYRLHKTRAERNYQELEPWIQWPSFYTGKTYAEHAIFRLGDVTGKRHTQIWEILERRGWRVGAISPINAANRCEQAAFFIPDPWTETPVTGPWAVRKLHAAIRDLVNENTTGRAQLSSVLWFGVLALAYARFRSLPAYLRAVLLRLRGQKWALASLLDRSLADLFIALWRKHQPDFASLFLNSVAHVQHHHLFESACYSGQSRNPEWYSSASRKGIDPVLTAYQVYDGILGDFMKLADVRLLVSTGLSQVANAKPIYQYRLKSHKDFLSRLGVGNCEIAPRMSRDFSVRLFDAGETEAATRLLQSVTVDGAPLISVDVRDGGDLFCKVSYQGPPEGLRRAKCGARDFDVADDVALVSIENGIHSTVGYHFDTALGVAERTGEQTDVWMPLTEIFEKIVGLGSDPSLGRDPVAVPQDAVDVDSFGDDEGEPRPT